MIQAFHQSKQSPKSSQSTTKSNPSALLRNHSSTDSNDDHIREILDSAEKWITQQLLFHEYVTAYDLLEQFDVDSDLARMLITRFEKRTSTYDIYPLSMHSTIPRSSLQPLEQMLASNNITNNTNTQTYNTIDINFDHDDDDNTCTDQQSTNTNTEPEDDKEDQNHDNPAIKPSNNPFLEPLLSGTNNVLEISPSVSPKMYRTPHDYIDYNKSSFDTWFSCQKHKYIISIQECAASYNIGLPEFIAEIIVINSILLPGCYTLTGLLFPAARNEGDLFAEHANKENGYITNKADKGIAYKRKKPMINVRRPENNTASLWLDEDGSICGFRCIWVHGIRGKLMVDQKFCVLNGCWTLSGEITITFEQWDVEDEFEGYLETETFCGRWTAGKELNGEFQWFITTIESFYLNHNIPIDNGYGQRQISVIGNDGHTTLYSTRLASFHDSMGVSMEDEFDLEDDILMSPMSSSNNIVIKDSFNVLYNKIFDIEINESLTITAKFLKQDNVLEISEKQDMSDITNIAASSDSFLSEDENEIIGYGKWLRNGKMSFENVKYVDQKLLLSFDGCCDGKKVLGRLCIYHDNTPDVNDGKNGQNGRNKKAKSISKYDTDDNDKIDIDDDDDQLFAGGVFDDDETEDEDDDDDERISFIQMIIVSNIIPA